MLHLRHVSRHPLYLPDGLLHEGGVGMITRETSDPLAITHDSVLQGGTLPGEGKGCALNFFRQRTLVHATLRKPTLCDVLRSRRGQSQMVKTPYLRHFFE